MFVCVFVYVCVCVHVFVCVRVCMCVSMGCQVVDPLCIQELQ